VETAALKQHGAYGPINRQAPHALEGRRHMPHTTSRRYELADLTQIAPVPCPCGQARRAFTDVADFPATVHRTDISADAKLHYHREHTETYYFLECAADAQMELDGDLIPVHPGMSVLIRPGCRHRAVGRMTVLVISMPKFDPADEWFD
jgi:mannose-6-phosphate isomerase-like protein (cupin superfamily)